MTNKYKSPKFVSVGQKVVARFGQTTTGIVCVVASAAGPNARIVNKKYRIDRWEHIDELRVWPMEKLPAPERYPDSCISG